jgi:nucleoside-diphosphate-sugar epimerase
MQEWIEQAAAGGHVTIPAGDEQDTWSYVADVAEAFSLAVRATNLPERHIFNIGGDFRARRELGTYLKTLVPEAHIEITNEVVESGYRSARHVNSRIAEALEFRPQWSLEGGVHATVNWTRERAGLAPVA